MTFKAMNLGMFLHPNSLKIRVFTVAFNTFFFWGFPLCIYRCFWLDTSGTEKDEQEES
jgi:hypothetical protein